jgi:hypothetical protein
LYSKQPGKKHANAIFMIKRQLFSASECRTFYLISLTAANKGLALRWADSETWAAAISQSSVLSRPKLISRIT